ncbi:PP2C family protein-serine/threonine phosphatase [Sandaracinus amylolyticus]|uniref:PP2C family protein-serine/threonine phosphatase n=1 Tax=Sandaracinus amylolyticus TaxID=927083 RepID=UPI001F48C3D2|nr:protein phosphatase 2C domain-containing protein [Sandaracinus amylolyticus]UJR81033.1 Serine/threonine phosphatase PrpC, regulation of stationary phase [Sandaracinus amylolyticus]
MRVISHASTHVGRRDNNEDAFCADDAAGLYVVADGMGGYEGGEVASRTAVDTLRKYFARMTPDGGLGLEDATDDHALARGRMDLALRIAHREICRKKVGLLAQMGSTVASVVLQQGHALISHVGDSRVYRMRGGILEAMTRDHSLYAEMEAAGRMSLPPRHQCSFQHVITRALGVPGDSRPDLRIERAQIGDVFVIASDGLTDVLEDEQLAGWVLIEPAETLTERLVEAALGAGAHDNITVVVARVVG